MFFSGVHFLCLLALSVLSNPVLPQWHVKGHGHSAESAGGRVHLNVRTPLTQRRQSGADLYCPGIVWEAITETSLHATHQATLAHGRLSSLSHFGLILA